MIENQGIYIMLTLHKILGDSDKAFISYKRISSVSPASQGGAMVITYESRVFYVNEDPQDITNKINRMKD